MLKILFSPSEGKHSGGSSSPQALLGAANARDEILDTYADILSRNDETEICSLFGIKKFKDALPYISNIKASPLMPAIQRYSGVAYEYLNFSSLSETEQEYLKDNTLIFSNLFGPLKGSDPIPIYKVKQGNSVGSIIPEKFYKERFSYQLDLFLGDDEILDLRAGYYEKFYKLTKPYTTLKFLKGGKTISHWAKAYRGIVLRELAKNNIATIAEFQALQIEGLALKEIRVIKNKTEIIYDIVE